MEPNDFDKSKDYIITADGQTIGYMRADFRRAADVILVSIADGEWQTSGRTVGDYSHDSDCAARDLFADVGDEDAEIEAI